MCTSFHDIKQHNDETVQDFYNRVSEVFRDAFLVKPAHVTTFDGAAEERHGLTEVQAALIMKRGIDKMQLLVMNTMFQGGLKEEIRSKVLEKGPTLIQESVKLAREFEIISKDKSKSEKGNYIASVSPDDNNGEPDEILEIEATELEHIKSINLIRKRQNKPPMRYKVRPSSKLPPSGQRPTCRYCKIEGHVQKVCRKRIAAGAPIPFGQLALLSPSPSGLGLSKLFMTLEVTSHVLTNLYFVLYLFNFGRRSAHLHLANSIIRRRATNLSSKAFILSKFRFLDEQLNTTFVLLKT